MTAPTTLDEVVDVLATDDRSTVDLYGDLAPVYDFVMEWGAVATVQYDAVTTALADDASAVVEFACGMGALLARLDEDYGMVVGLDRSRPLLRIARSKTDVALVRADVRRACLRRRFDAAVMLGNSVGHLTEPGDLGRCFESVAESLEPGGQFYFDCHDLEAHLDGERKEHPIEDDDYRVRHESELGPADPDSGLVERTDSFTITQKSSERTVTAETGTWEFRAYDVSTVRTALDEAGFEVVAVRTGDGGHRFLVERR